ncbi:MAG: hypothetical protein FJY77_05390 [Candidatus Altiarchaeales archaeon]|nr:hypothetical protein [Candidatus Altiarchaeales archaeon]
MPVVVLPKPKGGIQQEVPNPLERAREVHEHIAAGLLEQAEPRLKPAQARFYLAKVEEPGNGHSWHLMDTKNGGLLVFDKNFLLEGRGHLLGLSETLKPRSMGPGLLDEHEEARLGHLDGMPNESGRNDARGKCIASLYLAGPRTEGKGMFDIPATSLVGKISGNILDIHFYRGMRVEDESLLEKVMEGKVAVPEVRLALTNFASGKRPSEKAK